MADFHACRAVYASLGVGFGLTSDGFWPLTPPPIHTPPPTPPTLMPAPMPKPQLLCVI
ncbi:hypothetical protein Sjap_019527 [Stephania japonica]|uniref:Uncharacterized protein n=1 Tax=Stephania japonica TaxID=461633 RepID=A0AAP0F477_9MAGN